MLPNPVKYTPEDIARMEIRNFIAEGIKDVQNNGVYTIEEAFSIIKERLKDEEA